MSKPVSAKLVLIFKTTVSIGLLAFVCTRVDLSRAWSDFRHLSLSFVAFALAFYTGCQWLSCLRWQMILRSAGQSVPMSDLLSSYFAGMFLNTFLPGSVGGDAYRMYRVSRLCKDAEVAVVSVLLERTTGLVALMGIALAVIPPAFSLLGRWDILLPLIVCTACLVGGVLLLVSRRLLGYLSPLLAHLRLGGLINRATKMQGLIRSFLEQPQALGWSMGLSLLLQLILVYYYYLVAHQLGIAVSYLELLVFVPVVVVGSLLPFSLGGLGVREGLFAYLFTRSGLSVEQALLFSFTVMLLGWLLSLPGGLILLFDSAGKIRPRLN